MQYAPIRIMLSDINNLAIVFISGRKLQKVVEEKKIEEKKCRFPGKKILQGNEVFAQTDIPALR